MKTRSSTQLSAANHAENQAARPGGKRQAAASNGAGGGAKRRKALGTITNGNNGKVNHTSPFNLPPLRLCSRGFVLARLQRASVGRGTRRKSARSNSKGASSLVQSLVPACLQEDAPLPAGVRDIDEGEDDDPTLVSCYARPVYKHLLEVEVRHIFLQPRGC